MPSYTTRTARRPAAWKLPTSIHKHIPIPAFGSFSALYTNLPNLDIITQNTPCVAPHSYISWPPRTTDFTHSLSLGKRPRRHSIHNFCNPTMDYSSYYNAPQSYQFLGLPPTPVHTELNGSLDDFRNSPSVRAPSFHYKSSSPATQDLFPVQSKQYSQTFSSEHMQAQASYYTPRHYSPSPSVQRASPTSLPHTPTQPSLCTQAHLTQIMQQDVYDQFQTFDFNPQYANANHIQKSATPVQQHVQLQKPQQPHLHHKDSISSNGHSNGLNGFEVQKFEPNAYPSETSQEDRSAGQQNSNSDDDDMTPAQSRRKAQNRAAYVSPETRSRHGLTYLQTTSISRAKRAPCQGPRDQTPSSRECLKKP